jgi:hypothetical protein
MIIKTKTTSKTEEKKINFTNYTTIFIINNLIEKCEWALHC